mmetsp:Transcript_14869/g.39653  ORF Transcript_14869/g.39653 Transcript_14869/m.39653 type:complete len:232 (-) Transcript_14869:15-710(-)
MIPPLWPWYTAAAGAPGSAPSSPDCCICCSRPVSLPASEELIREAWTIAVRACVRAPAPFSCSMDAPCLSRMPMALSRVSMMSMSSAFSAEKSADSFSLMKVEALRSASSVAICCARSSAFAVRELTMAVSSLMMALRSWISDFEVLISNARFLLLSSHHSENSSYTFCDPSPSLMTFACRSESISSTLPIGFTCSAEALARVIEEATQRIAATAIFIAPSLWRGGSYSCC